MIIYNDNILYYKLHVNIIHYLFIHNILLINVHCALGFNIYTVHLVHNTFD